MTKVLIDITGYEDVLAAAVGFENNHLDMLNDKLPRKDATTYLQDLVTRQLEGLKGITERIKADEEVRHQANQQARLMRPGLLGKM